MPNTVLSQHLVVLGKTRSGKSSTMRLMVEELLDDEKPVCIIDPKGDWWGIKSSKNGKAAGYPLVIFGGKHADVPINASSGKIVGELVATGNRPCLIDLGGWMVGERTRFFIDFASTLFTRTHGHRWLVIDECHNFAFQGKIMDPESGKLLHWSNRLASEGAGRGIVLISASQRPQKVHKDYLTSHETLIAKRVIHPLDRNAMKEWIDGCGDPTQGRAVLDSLAHLQRSEGWVWSPEIGFGPKRVQFPMFKTYDSFAVQTGSADRKLKGWASVDLDDVRQKLAAAIEEDKANDPKALRVELAAVKTQLAKQVDHKTPATDKGAVREAEARGFEQAKKKLTAAMQRSVNKSVNDAVKRVGDLVRSKTKELLDEMAQLHGSIPAIDEIALQPSSDVMEVHRVAPNAGVVVNGAVPPTVRKILNEIHRAYPMALSFEAAALRAAVSRRSSAYNKYREIVRSSAEIEQRDDGKFKSAPGFAAPLPIGNDPIETFAARLPPSYAAMLHVIAATSGRISKRDVAIGAGVSPRSSGLSAGLNELIALGLIEKEGPRGEETYAVNSDLFYA